MDSYLAMKGTKSTCFATQVYSRHVFDKLTTPRCSLKCTKTTGRWYRVYSIGSKSLTIQGQWIPCCKLFRKQNDISFRSAWKASHSSTKDDDEDNSKDNPKQNNHQGGGFPFSIFGNWSSGGDKGDNQKKNKEGFSIPGMGGRNTSLSTENLDISSALAAYDKEKRNELLEFIQQVPPSELVARFMRKTPKDVQNAIKVNLVQLLGSLPPGIFQTSIRTVGMQLMQLMESCLMTGYMLRNAQYRYSLTKSLELVDDKRRILEGPKPLVQGKVTFENADGSTTEIEASEYVEELRSQVVQLEKELNRYKNASGSQLLSYIRTMEQEQLESLTRDMGDEVVDAMKRIIRAVTMQTSIAQNPMSVVETSTGELSQMLFWLLVTGYFLREAEVQQNIQQMLSN